MPTTVLVTGGAGYIGAHACLALHQAGFTPVTLDDLSAGQRGRVQWGPLIIADVRDAAAVNTAFAQYQPQAVLHFAGQISVPESVQQPLHAYTTNTLGKVLFGSFGVKLATFYRNLWFAIGLAILWIVGVVVK